MVPAGRATGERPVFLVLVEVLNRDPTHRYPAQLFPFARGLDVLDGVRTAWWRLGTDADPADLAPRLADDDRQALLERLDAARPTHVCLNVPADTALRAGLERMSPAPQVRVLNEGIRSGAWFRSFLDWLGRADAFDRAFPDAVHPLDEIPPSYRAEDLNATATLAPWWIEIAVGRPCTWHRPLSNNPHFAALPEVGDWCGCSFCEAADAPTEPSRIAPMEAVFRHLEGVRVLALSPVRRPSFSLVGSHLFLRFKAFFARVLSMGDFPPSRFLFTCRIDEFLRLADGLEEMLPTIEAAGHQVVVFSMGIENLSAVENARFNKGISADQVLAVRDRMARIKARFPDGFDFPSGNLSFILFTPWTTADDLETNLREARRIGLDIGGNFLRSRLQLIPGRPITALVEADGLLLPEMPDHPFFSGCIRSPDIHELPWRFREPGMDACYAVMRRLDPAADVPADDPVLAQVRRALLHFPIDVLSLADLARLCVAVTRSDPAENPETLLAACIRQAFDRTAAADGRGTRPLSPAMVARVLARVSAADPAFLDGARVAALRVELPWVLMDLEASRGPVSLMLTAARPGQGGVARSERYVICTRDEGDGPLPERVQRLATRIAGILDGVGGPGTPG
jgi:hypothetical protein